VMACLENNVQRDRLSALTEVPVATEIGYA
jgi:hypothetical protein